MARKRKRSRAAEIRAAYSRGRQAGLTAAKKKRHAQAVAAGKKSGEARRAKKAKPKAPPAVTAVDELVLYEAQPDDAADALGLLTDFVEPSEWVAHLIQLDQGQLISEDDVTMDADWEREGRVATDLRRVWRAWHNEQKARLSLEESPAIGIVRLALRKAGAAV